MTRITILPLLCGALSALCAQAVPADPVTPFTDVRIFAVDDSAGRDLSGLALCDGALYAIADKVDDSIFRIDLDGRRAVLKKARAVPPVPPREANYEGTAALAYRYQELKSGDVMDWEDIACFDGAFYLLSERKNAILRIAGDTAAWLDAPWYDRLHESGYLTRYNAYVEGIAVFDADHIWVALEREPRGLLQLTRDSDGRWRPRALPLGNEQQLEFRDNNADFSALYRRGDFLYTLERNASAICRRDLSHLRALSCHSFMAIENDPAYRYAERRYGMAEGLALDEHWLYVVFDNNGIGFERDPADRRALLLQIPLPADWR